MGKFNKNETGSAVLAVLVVIVIALIGVAGWLVYKNHHKTTTVPATSTAKAIPSKTTTTPANPYAGWKTYCDTTVKACFKYPSDWTTSQYGGLENTAQTEYASLDGPNNKDRAADDAYIASISDLSMPNADLKILGTVVDNQPAYAIYDASYITANNLKVGDTHNIVDGNYDFDGQNGMASFVGTPNVNGYALIKTSDQAKAWFDTTEGKTVLEVLQSLYFQ